MSDYKAYWVNYKRDITVMDMPCISYEFIHDSILVFAIDTMHARRLAQQCSDYYTRDYR